jgi:hypothetical protein
MWEICGHILRSQRIRSVYMWYPLVIFYGLLLKMTIEIVDIPIKHGDFPQ